MASENEILVQVKLETGEVTKGFIKIEKEAKESGASIGNNLSKGISSIGASFGGLQAKLIGLAASIAGAFSLKKAIEEANNAEKATNQLNTALSQLGKFSKEASDEFAKFAKSQEQLTGVQADVITQSAALLVNVGKLSGDGLQKASKASLDLAQALQIDVGTAFEVVSKAAAGNLGALSRYGIKIDESIPKSQQFAEVLKQLETRFGGAAESRLNTFSGAIDSLGNAVDNVFEAFGNLIIQSPVVRELVKTVGASIQQFADSIEGLGAGGDIVGKLVKELIRFSIVLNDFVIRPTEFFVRGFLVGIDLIVLAAQGLITAFVKVGQAITEYVIAPLVNFYGGVLSRLVGVFDKDLGAQIDGIAKGVSTKLVEVTSEIGNATGAAYQERFNSFLDSTNGALNTSAADGIEGFLTKLNTAVATAKPAMAEFKNSNIQAAQESGLAWQSFGFTLDNSFASIKEGFAKAAFDLAGTAANMQKSFKAIGQSALQGLGGAVGQSFAAFGKALASGGDAAQAFADAFIGAIGGMLVQLGTSYILQGIAASANPLTPGIGGPLIAAGAALATFGGVLQSVSGKGGASAPAAGGGGGVAAEPGAISTELVTPEDQQQKTEPGTQINVRVDGNILDRRQTGLELTEVIREAFETQGAVAVQSFA